MFRSKKKEQAAQPQTTRPVAYPSGLMVTTEKCTWYILGGKRLKVYSQRCLASWGVTPVLGTEASLSKFPASSRPLGFRDGTLIKDISDGRIYLVSQAKRRHIVNPDDLTTLGLRLNDAVVVSSAEAGLHEDGDDLDGI